MLVTVERLGTSFCGAKSNAVNTRSERRIVCHTSQWPAHANLYILTLIGFEAAPSGTPTSIPKGTRFSFDPVKGSLISPANIHRNQRPETVTLEGGQVASEGSWLRFSLSVRPCVPGVVNSAALWLSQAGSGPGVLVIRAHQHHAGSPGLCASRQCRTHGKGGEPPAHPPSVPVSGLTGTYAACYSLTICSQS